jgi:hypothetical protein
LHLFSDTEDETWHPEEEEYTEEEEQDSAEEEEDQASDDTLDSGNLEVLEASVATGDPDVPLFGKPSEFYPAVIEPIQDGVNLERSGSYGKVGTQPLCTHFLIEGAQAGTHVLIKKKKKKKKTSRQTITLRPRSGSKTIPQTRLTSYLPRKPRTIRSTKTSWLP